MIHTLFDIILLGGICAVHHRMLHTLRGGRFDCLLTLISLKMKHPRPLQVCTIVCIIYDAHRGRGDYRNRVTRMTRRFYHLRCCCFRLKQWSASWFQSSKHRTPSSVRRPELTIHTVTRKCTMKK